MMLKRLLKPSIGNRVFSNGAAEDDILYLLPRPRHGEVYTFFFDGEHSITIDSNSPEVPILTEGGPSKTYELNSEKNKVGDSIEVRCVGSIWRVIPRFF